MNFLLVISLTFLSFQLFANTQSSYELEDIVHTQEAPKFDGIFTDENSDDIDEEEMDNANISSVDDLLRLSNSATTSRGPRTSGEAPQVRGLDKNKIAVSIDGIRQNYQEGHTSMIPLDTETLKAVKVYTSGSDFSQSASLGGSVVFKTIDPEDLLKKSKQAYSLKTQYNGANEEKLLNVKAAYKQKRTSLLTSFTQKTADELKLSDGSLLDNSSFDEINFLGKIKRGIFSGSYSFFRRLDDSPIDPSLNPPTTYKSLLSENTTLRNSVSLKYNNSKTKAQVYLNKHNVDKVNEETNLTTKREIETIGLAISRNYNNWNYGIDVYRDDLKGTESGNNLLSYPNANSTIVSSFLQRKFVFDQLTVIPGIKVHHYSVNSKNNNFTSKSSQNLSKNILSIYKLNNKLSLNASYSEGFNSPKVNEIYPSGLHNPGDDFVVRDNFFIPNLKLTHETSVQWEGGVKYSQSLFNKYDRLSFNFSTYLNKIDNYIKPERIDRSILDDEDGTTQFVNVPKVSLYGTEAKIQYLNSFLDLSLAYNRVRGRDESLDIYLEDLPADQYTFNAVYYLEKINLQAGYSAIQTLKQDRVNPNTLQRTDETPAYLIHNVFLRKELTNNLDLNLRVDNLGNTKYRRHASHLYESGEDVKVALKYKINL